MKKQKILVTGSEGFLGKNLVLKLNEIGVFEVLKYDIRNTDEELEIFAREADFIFHFAGVNRAQAEVDFIAGNKDLTGRLTEILKSAGNAATLLISSSVQAQLDNVYGRTKKAAEDAVFQYGRETGAKIYVYRFPNLFGKWCRPNYNSVVATFCHNTARGIPITINDPSVVLTLAYIDDVVAECIAALNGNAFLGDDGFCHVRTVYKASLQEIADAVVSFRNIRETGEIPDLSNKFVYALYSTYISYLSEDMFAYCPDFKRDNRGWLFELLKSDTTGQIFISTTKPGITRGNHYHHKKTEKFVVLKGQAAIRFRRTDSNEIIVYNVSGDNVQVVDIPPGFTHHIENTGEEEVLTLFWASEKFDPDKPDTYYMPVIL